VRIHAWPGPRLPNTSHVAFEGVEAETLLAGLSSSGLCASAGSACNAGARKPSHVLSAVGLGPDEAAASVRFSFSRFTTPEEVDRGLALLAELVPALRGV
jgi:cysteine desulfurase